MRHKTIQYGLFILVPIAIGALAGVLTYRSMLLYESIPKSDLTPPSYVFPIVWNVLYVLMGIGTAMVYRARNRNRYKNWAMLVFFIQLLINFSWSLIFFNLQSYLFAFCLLILLWVLVLIMTLLFYRVRKAAGLLQIPYLLWVLFAGYLNYVIWSLNR